MNTTLTELVFMASLKSITTGAVSGTSKAFCAGFVVWTQGWTHSVTNVKGFVTDGSKGFGIRVFPFMSSALVMFTVYCLHSLSKLAWFRVTAESPSVHVFVVAMLGVIVYAKLAVLICSLKRMKIGFVCGTGVGPAGGSVTTMYGASRGTV